ncbi:MAG: hypothetical protein GXP27_00840 [Planctomycetes bacterium]|nr:hypothetical protein [Planctomycetota bacterium]
MMAGTKAKKECPPDPLSKKLERTLLLLRLLGWFQRRTSERDGGLLFAVRQGAGHTWVVVCDRRGLWRAIRQLVQWARDPSLPLTALNAAGLAIRLALRGLRRGG